MFSIQYRICSEIDTILAADAKFLRKCSLTFHLTSCHILYIPETLVCGDDKLLLWAGQHHTIVNDETCILLLLCSDPAQFVRGEKVDRETWKQTGAWSNLHLLRILKRKFSASNQISCITLQIEYAFLNKPYDKVFGAAQFIRLINLKLS